MAKATKKYQSRTFLNSDEGMAALEAKVEWWHKDYAYANVSISDCKRQVDLDFDYDTAEQKAKRMEKLDKLIEELTKFRGELFSAD